MIYKVYCVYDRAADVFSVPQFTNSLGSAVRQFGDQCKDKSDKANVLAQHPEDFALYEIGTYDDASTVYEGILPPKLLAKGSDYSES